MFKNIKLLYIISLLKSIGTKNFEGLGRTTGCTGKTIMRSLPTEEAAMPLLQKIGHYVFRKKRTLYLAIDDTLIKKIYAQAMAGAGLMFSTKDGRCLNAFRIQVAALTDGKCIIPIDFSYILSKEILDSLNPEDLTKISHLSKVQLFQNMVNGVKKQYPLHEIIVVADGLFCTTEILKWCKESKTNTVMRMHSNRTVEFNNQKIAVNKIEMILPKGRQKARSVPVLWYDMDLFLTAEKRLDKHGKISIVYLISTFKAKPIKYVKIYKKRWGIEKMFRTIKQHLGLNDCFSTNFDKQKNHLAAVLLTFALMQIARKQSRFENIETAIRSFKSLSFEEIESWILRLDQNFKACAL